MTRSRCGRDGAGLLPIVFLLAALLPARGADALTLGYREIGLSLGNEPRAIGLRLNAIDADVERVAGLNLTLWNPRPSPAARMSGAALGLIGPKAGRLEGLALGGLGATATEHIRGLAAAGFGVGTNRLAGLALGGLLTDIKADSRGLVAAGIACRVRGRLDGLAVSGVFIDAAALRGVSCGALAALGKRCDGLALTAGILGLPEVLNGLGVGGLVAGGGRLRGLGLSAGVLFWSEGIDGLALGGITALSAGNLRGVALSAGVAGAKADLSGFALGGLGAGTEGRLRGVALGGLVAIAAECDGLSLGALNGVIVEDVNLEDFLKVRTVSRRHRGLAIGLVNYTEHLQGAQIGLFNYAGNNPRWARLLPILNLHL